MVAQSYITCLFNVSCSFHVRYLAQMAHESQEVDDKMWPPHVEHVFTEIMLEELLKGNMENGVFKGPIWQTITTELNS